MRGFIQILNSNNKRVLINIKHITDIVESDKNNCIIYINYFTDSNVFYSVNESYESIKSKIEAAMK